MAAAPGRRALEVFVVVPADVAAVPVGVVVAVVPDWQVAAVAVVVAHLFAVARHPVVFGPADLVSEVVFAGPVAGLFLSAAFSYLLFQGSSG